MSAASFRVVLADDHPIFRSGLAFELQQNPSLVAVGEASSGHEAVEFVRRLAPDVAVVDLRMPGLDGLGVLRALRRDGVRTRFALLSAFRDQAAIYAAMEAGASAYLMKDAPRKSIVNAIEAVARGGIVVAPEAQESLVAELRCQHTRRAAVLSVREVEVVELLADGRSGRQVGERLFIAPTTVKTHVKRIGEKLDVDGQTAIVAAAIRRGIIS